MITQTGKIEIENAASASVPIPSYWWIEDTAAHCFNRLKGKIFNLIEASMTDKEQQEAVKGLIKGFANDEYRSCIVDMRYQARLAGFISDKEDSATPPLSSYPLEDRLSE